jgi:hypothetical protein
MEERRACTWRSCASVSAIIAFVGRRDFLAAIASGRHARRGTLLCSTAKSAARLPVWVNCTHYRAAALLSASPQLAESIRAAKRFRVV